MSVARLATCRAYSRVLAHKAEIRSSARLDALTVERRQALAKPVARTFEGSPMLRDGRSHIQGSLRRLREKNVWAFGLLAGRNIGGCRLPHRAKISCEAINGTKVLCRHVTKSEPRHRRAELCSVSGFYPFVFSKFLHIQPEIHRIGRPPGTTETNLIPGQPLFFRNIAARLSVAWRVTIIATCYFNQISASVDGILLDRYRGLCGRVLGCCHDCNQCSLRGQTP